MRPRKYSSSAPGLVLEISALELVDTYVARVLTNTAKMARLATVADPHLAGAWLLLARHTARRGDGGEP